MADLWTVLFSWLPAWFQVVVLGLIALTVIFIIVKVIGLILNAIPFL